MIISSQEQERGSGVEGLSMDFTGDTGIIEKCFVIEIGAARNIMATFILIGLQFRIHPTFMCSVKANTASMFYRAVCSIF